MVPESKTALLPRPEDFALWVSESPNSKSNDVLFLNVRVTTLPYFWTPFLHLKPIYSKPTVPGGDPLDLTPSEQILF